MFQVIAFVDKVVDSKGVELSITDTSFGDIVCLLYIIEVAFPAVALDVDVEHLLDGRAPVVEGAQGDVCPSAQAGTQPSLIDFLERDFPASVDGVYQPDVFIKQVFRHGAVAF